MWRKLSLALIYGVLRYFVSLAYWLIGSCHRWLKKGYLLALVQIHTYFMADNQLPTPFSHSRLRLSWRVERTGGPPSGPRLDPSLYRFINPIQVKARS
ncbi:hypothetical protein F4778DRAFT_764239 [Xylariomycetidae sp. FL2044]|nr:hypothetical protein F4778DRAFT_764239 [Xylariomycetidae sp. FL2044]